MKRTIFFGLLIVVFVYAADSWGQPADVQTICKDVPAGATMVKCTEKCECTWCGDGKVSSDEFCDIGDGESCGRGRICKACTECASGVTEENLPTENAQETVNPAEVFRGSDL